MPFCAFVLSLFLYATLLHGSVSSECEKLEKAFIIGDYTACENLKDQADSSLRCKYIRSLCMMGNGAYDKARYELSIISAEVPKSSLAPGNINALALISLAEIAFLQGDYRKARTLSDAVNELISKKLPRSYPYSVSQVLSVKACFDARDLAAALKRLNNIRKENTDALLYSALDPWT